MTTRLHALGRVAAVAALAAAAPGATASSGPGADRQRPHDYRIVRWTTQEGLPQNTISDIASLATGEVWLATFGGLVRFDGERFQTVDIAADPGLPSNRITGLIAAGGSSLQFVTQEGHLGSIDRGRAEVRLQPTGLRADLVDFVTLPNGGAFAEADDGSYWEGRAGQPWRQVLGAPEGGRGSVRTLAVTPAGEIWAAWGRNLARLDAGADATLVPLPERAITVAARSSGGLWVGFGAGMGYFESGRLTHLDVRPPVESPVRMVVQDDEASLWIAGRSEVSRLERQADGSWRRQPLELGVRPGVMVRSLGLDRKGSLWVGTDGRGLYRVNRQPTLRLGAESGLGPVGALAPDGAGGAWVGSGCLGFFHVDRLGRVRRVGLAGESGGAAPDGCEFAVAGLGSGDAWVRARQGIYRVERDSLRAWRVPLDLPDESGPLVPVPDGSVWVVSPAGRADRVGHTGTIVEQLQIPAGAVSATLAPDGSFWLGGDGEVVRIARGQVERFGREAGVPRGAVRTVFAEADGTVWVATYGGGLGCFREGRFLSLTSANALPDNAVSGIVNDGRGRLWLSTNRGVVVFERRELLRAAGAGGRLHPVVLGYERGVPEAHFGRPAGFADVEGRVWFATIEGVVRIDAGRFPFDRVPPVVHIESVSADQRTLPLGPSVLVPAGTERVRLEFAVYERLYPERTAFRFRFEGVDKDWVDVGSRGVAVWTPAGPGRQRFLVQARNEDGVWSAAPTSLDLEIPPLWWETALFRVLAAISGALGVFGVFRMRLRAVERRHAERVRALEEQRRAEERVAGLRAQLEHVSRAAIAGELAAGLAHEVNQPLTAIMANAQTGARLVARGTMPAGEMDEIFTDIQDSARRASEVIRGLRGFLQKGGPEAGEVDLSDLVREMLPLVRRELRAAGVETSLDLGDRLPPVEGFRVQLGQVVVNLVLNACEALGAVEGARRVWISTLERDERVELVVRDNGPGLSPDTAARIFEPFVTTKPDGMGMGLAICRTIAEAHGGQLSAAEPPDGGLSVVLSLPAARPGSGGRNGPREVGRGGGI